MVLFVFVIMLLNAGAETDAAGRSLSVQALGAAAAGRAFWDPRLSSSSACSRMSGRALRRLHRRRTAQRSACALFTTYLLPFEVTSVLILIAIVGAIVLARKEID